MKQLLRWRYDYLDKSPKYGQWLQAATIKSDMAAFNRDKIVRAAIEAKDVKSRVVKVVAEVDGHDFRTFRWLAMARTPGIIKGSFTPVTELVGLALWSSDGCVEVYIDGAHRVRALTEGEKSINLATYGK